MKLTYTVKKVAFLLLSASSLSMFSQVGDKLKDGMKYFTDSKDSTHFIKLNLNNQIWTRYTINDPLTVVNGYS